MYVQITVGCLYDETLHCTVDICPPDLSATSQYNYKHRINVNYTHVLTQTQTSMLCPFTAVKSQHTMQKIPSRYKQKLVVVYHTRQNSSEASMTRFRYRIALEGPAIDAGGHRMGFTPRKSDHNECRGVYISVNPITLSAEVFRSSTPNIGVKKRNRIEIDFFIKNRIRIKTRGKNHNRHITTK